MEVAQINGGQRFWGGVDMMAAGGTDKRIDIGAAEKRGGFDEDGSCGRRHTDADAR